jgi:membrane protein
MPTPDPAQEVLRRPWLRAPWEIYRAVQAHDCFFLAAGVSFYSMLSLVPMLFLLLSVIGYFLQGTELVRQDLLDAVHQYIPFLSAEIVRNIDQVVRNPGLLGWIGGLGLLFSADLVFVAVQSALDRIFVPGRRGFLRAKLLSVLLAVVVFTVILLTIAINAVDQSLENLQASSRIAGPVGLHLSTGTIGVVLLLCFTLAIRMLPHVHVPARYAFPGGALGAGLWILAKSTYAGYLQDVSKVGPLFGSLSAVVLTLIWVYVSTFVFLVGAEFTRWLILTDPRRPDGLGRPAGDDPQEEASGT